MDKKDVEERDSNVNIKSNRVLKGNKKKDLEEGERERERERREKEEGRGRGEKEDGDPGGRKERKRSWPLDLKMGECGF